MCNMYRWIDLSFFIVICMGYLFFPRILCWFAIELKLHFVYFQCVCDKTHRSSMVSNLIMGPFKRLHLSSGMHDDDDDNNNKKKKKNRKR